MTLAFLLLLPAACDTPASDSGICNVNEAIAELTVRMEGVAGESEVVLFEGEAPLAQVPVEGLIVTLPLPEPGSAELAGYPHHVALVAADGVFLEVASEWLAWSEEAAVDPDDPFEQLAGWNLLESQMTQGSARTGECAVGLGTDLRPRPSAVFQGTLAPELAEGRRIALVSERAREGEAVALPVLVDMPAAERWTLAVQDPPPDDHLAEYRTWSYNSGDSVEPVAWEELVLYEDTDGSGAWSAGDTDVGTGCANGGEGSGLRAAWAPPATSLAAARAAQHVGLGTGWLATEGRHAATRETPLNVGFDTDCD